MKFLSNLILFVLAVTVLDISIIDSRDDRSKSLVVIGYSDGTEDILVVDKKRLLSEDPDVMKTIVEIAKKRRHE